MTEDARKTYIPYAPRERIVCGCGKGYASHYDKLCRFCRAKTLRNAQIRKAGLKPHMGVTIEEYLKITENR